MAQRKASVWGNAAMAARGRAAPSALGRTPPEETEAVEFLVCPPSPQRSGICRMRRARKLELQSRSVDCDVGTDRVH